MSLRDQFCIIVSITNCTQVPAETESRRLSVQWQQCEVWKPRDKIRTDALGNFDAK